jgi:hypothetical protein
MPVATARGQARLGVRRRHPPTVDHVDHDGAADDDNN